ncbi:MAG: chloramphenicol acetyltransferase [Rubrivivax sp.]|jgi:hypothetical protein|nr:chloramphenicol acetyltransferase [Rubrivivax sp.]
MELGEQATIDDTALVEDSRLGRWTWVGARSTLTETELGDYSYIMNDSSLIHCRIGRFCSIAAHTRINPGNHPTWRAAQHHFSYRSRHYRLAEDDDQDFFAWRRSHPVILDHDVWVGHGAIILPGVTVGSGAVVAAGAVVTKAVAPFTVVAGVPARVIRARFDERTVSALLEISWWDWPHEQIRDALTDFRHLTGEQFVIKHGRRQ